MKRPATNPLDDVGLEPSDLAATAMRVAAAVVGAAPDDEPGPGWLAVARLAVAMFAEGDGEVSVSFPEVAALLCRAYYRAEGVEPPALDDAAKALWEALARHLVNVCLMEPTDLRRLDTHEARIAAWAAERLKKLPPSAAPKPR